MPGYDGRVEKCLRSRLYEQLLNEIYDPVEIPPCMGRHHNSLQYVLV